jgi:hypothetical protein
VLGVRVTDKDCVMKVDLEAIAKEAGGTQCTITVGTRVII